MNPALRTAVHLTVLILGVGWLLHVGADILVPLVLAVMLLYVIDGVARLLASVPGLGRYVPSAVIRALSIAVILALGVYAAQMLVASLGAVLALAPQYEASALAAIQAAAAYVGLETEPTWQTLRRDVLSQVSLQRLVGTTVTSVTAIVVSFTVILLYGAFLLVERRAVARKLDRLSGDAQRVAQMRRIIANINAKVGSYLALKTLVSIVQGLVAWGVLAWFDVQFAPFWAVLTGLLNFVPYIGTILSVVLPVAVATMQFADLGTVLTLAVALSAAQFFIGFFIDPWLMSSSLNLSPLVILLSIAVWSALWGIPGAFLAVPLTACIAMVCAEFPGTRPIAVLLSQDGNVPDPWRPAGGPAAASPPKKILLRE